uniref:Uncharacterized protein n=1 Tax=Rhizophora mucronata TaxID=61149 RepID=A0A2P2NUH0_RHIMU
MVLVYTFHPIICILEKSILITHKLLDPIVIRV